MNLNDPIFTDEAKARAHLEAIRWPNGPECPHCGNSKTVYRLNGKAARPGLIHCNACEGQFTVTTGGVMESSHIPLTKWTLGFYLYSASKKGFSAHQLHRQLGISYKSAWFMAHRIREAMATAAGSEPPLGGEGKIVEADETELGKSHKTKRKPGRKANLKFLALIERGGKVRSRTITGANGPISIDIHKALRSEIDRASTLHTDGAKHYKLYYLDHEAVDHNKELDHEAVDHNKEYVRKGKAGKVHTNSAEGYFSLFKRGLVGTYQHIDERHLPRYLAEFDFRMNNREKLGVNDAMRAARAIKGAEGKRLKYQGPRTA